jgi:hypothetical protein
MSDRLERDAPLRAEPLVEGVQRQKKLSCERIGVPFCGIGRRQVDPDVDRAPMAQFVMTQLVKRA